MTINLVVALEIQCFELGIFSFNWYVYNLALRFIAWTCAVNLRICAFNFTTLVFNLLTRVFNLASLAFSLLTCGFELVTSRFELVTSRFKLVTRRFELVTCGFELVTHGFELVTRFLLFHLFCLIWTQSCAVLRRLFKHFCHRITR